MGNAHIPGSKIIEKRAFPSDIEIRLIQCKEPDMLIYGKSPYIVQHVPFEDTLFSNMKGFVESAIGMLLANHPFQIHPAQLDPRPSKSGDSNLLFNIESRYRLSKDNRENSEKLNLIFFLFDNTSEGNALDFNYSLFPKDIHFLFLIGITPENEPYNYRVVNEPPPGSTLRVVRSILRNISIGSTPEGCKFIVESIKSDFLPTFYNSLAGYFNENFKVKPFEEVEKLVDTRDEGIYVSLFGLDLGVLDVYIREGVQDKQKINFFGIQDKIREELKFNSKVISSIYDKYLLQENPARLLVIFFELFGSRGRANEYISSTDVICCTIMFYKSNESKQALSFLEKRSDPSVIPIQVNTGATNWTYLSIDNFNQMIFKIKEYFDVFINEEGAFPVAIKPRPPPVPDKPRVPISEFKKLSPSVPIEPESQPPPPPTPVFSSPLSQLPPTPLPPPVFSSSLAQIPPMPFLPPAPLPFYSPYDSSFSLGPPPPSSSLGSSPPSSLPKPPKTQAPSVPNYVIHISFTQSDEKVISGQPGSESIEKIFNSTIGAIQFVTNQSQDPTFLIDISEEGEVFNTNETKVERRNRYWIKPEKKSGVNVFSFQNRHIRRPVSILGLTQCANALFRSMTRKSNTIEPLPFVLASSDNISYDREEALDEYNRGFADMFGFKLYRSKPGDAVLWIYLCRGDFDYKQNGSITHRCCIYTEEDDLFQKKLESEGVIAIRIKRAMINIDLCRASSILFATLNERFEI